VVAAPKGAISFILVRKNCKLFLTDGAKMYEIKYGTPKIAGRDYSGLKEWMWVKLNMVRVLKKNLDIP